MGKSTKNKKNKVPKITEEEYVQYLSSLKDEGQVSIQRKTIGVKTQPNISDTTLK